MVDGSFFPNRLWHVLAFWFVVADSMMIGAGDFITSSTTDYRSSCAAELCGCLDDLQSIDFFPSVLNESSNMDVSVATDYLGFICKLEK